ncbi:hypothetical protein KPH14_010306 [Odynerus spinipes]|uniref:Small ribosomal subunit protein uS15m n=1 Tax=Odynerus spinipes TaxID=1348599 RepID=A0AAD9VTN2_9HYME|nr:hypothetical protein KPH14_010306 [Odynerus spinipes]
MNALANCCRHFPKVAVNVAKSRYFVREYAVLADYNIKWVRPEKISITKPGKSGDLGITVDVKSTDFMLKYEKSKELQDADDIVKRLVTLEFQPRRETINARREKIMELVKRHNLDRGSAEAKIAAMTSEVLQLQEYMENNPRCTKTRIFLKELIEKRKKMLKKLRIWDYKRFEWIIEKLNLIFKAGPSVPGKACRKDALRKLTQKHCDNIMKEKFDAYKEELKEQQKIFFKDKLEKLIFIRKEELQLGVEPTVTEDDIEAIRKRLEVLYEPTN